MPIYTYKCLPNEHVFEKKLKFTDPPITECPECGGDVRKVINRVGVVFKGSGFYVTDTRSNNSAGPAAGGGSSGSNGSSESAPKSESSSSESSNKAESKSSSDSASAAPSTLGRKS